MLPEYAYGEAVRVIRNVRNDGTFAGLDTGKLLVRRGSVGYVRDIGTFLQDRTIYIVDFLQAGRVVGCYGEELQAEAASWIPCLFEFHDKVTPTVPLGRQGRVLVEPGVVGEVEKVLCDGQDGVTYHVRFSSRTLQVPESVLNLSNCGFQVEGRVARNDGR